MKTLSAGLDSLTIVTPIASFKQLDYRITSKVTEVFQDTGEIYQEHKNIPLIIDDYGIKLRCNKIERFKKVLIQLTLNSRIFGSDLVENGHFQFLTLDKVKNILTRINNYFLYDIDPDVWTMESTVYDVDFAMDYRVLQLVFDKQIDQLTDIETARIYYTKKETIYNNKQRVISGIQFVNRADGSIKKPFCKVYTKFYELWDKSSVFRDMHLREFNDQNIRRAEVTVRNSKHFESLSKKGILSSKFMKGDITLFNVLSLSMYDCRNIVQHLFQRHMNFKWDVGRLEVDNSITPSNYFIGQLVAMLLNDGYHFENIMRIMDKYPTENEDKRTQYKSRIKKRVIDAIKSNSTPLFLSELTNHQQKFIFEDFQQDH